MLTIRSVAHRYGGRRVLKAPDLSLAAGEHCALVGPSGSGKSTLLNILAGILPPTAGDVSLQGEPLYTAPARDDRWRARRIGVVPQRLHLLASLSARDNVRLAQYLAGAGSDTAESDRLLAALGVEARADARPGELSAGEQQRVAIARAIVNRPQVLLADEPTSSLDDDNARSAIDLLFEAARIAGALLVVATHDGRVRARFDRTVELSRPVQ
jgi:putative ABC transport system ATP-binding protein